MKIARSDIGFEWEDACDAILYMIKKWDHPCFTWERIHNKSYIRYSEVKAMVNWIKTWKKEPPEWWKGPEK